MNYSMTQNEDLSISLAAAYIPYNHFQLSRGYKAGFKYTEYLNLLTYLRYPDFFYGSIFSFKERLCRVGGDGGNDIPIWTLPSLNEKVGLILISSNMAAKAGYQAIATDLQPVLCNQVRGFFNLISGDSAVLDLHDMAGGYNLVSSNWID
jgi:hypothetical protein